MKPTLLLPLIILSAMLQSCSKDAIIEDPKVNDQQLVVTPQAVGDPVYSFSELQVITGATNAINSPRGYSITKSHLTYLVNTSSSNIIIVNTSDGLDKRYTYPGGTAPVGPYLLDNEEKNFFIAYRKVLYRFALSNSAVTAIAKGLGNVSSLKSMGAGVIALSSDTLGGSIVLISAIGAKSIIASNLGYPESLTFYKNEYFVVNNNIINASVLKVDALKKVTTIISNLTGVGKITVDNFGTLIVGVQKTINSYPYRTYDLYTSTGSFLTGLKDNTGKQIFGNRYISTTVQASAELFVDSFNNLLFYHAGQSPPSPSLFYPLGSGSIWKVRLIKTP